MTNTIDINEIDKNQSLLGPKTTALAKLVGLGLSVPPFLAITSETLLSLLVPSPSEELALDRSRLEDLANEIRERLNVPSYAVRSSGLGEDGAESSQAGCFHSEINIPPEGLSGALTVVLRKAHERLAGEINKFSVIVQAFKQAEFSGVLFTRNPLGERELLIEYAAGGCDATVGGRNKPDRVTCFHRGERNSVERFASLIDQSLRIEQHFSWPQDIEWCFAEGRFWFLQSRPITTISAAQYEGMKYLDDILLEDKPLLLEKTGVSEVAPNACPATFSLLQRIYAADGPVAKVYRKFGVRYSERQFLRMVGNELFCDREQEIKSLLPSYGLQSDGSMGLRNFWPTAVCRTFINSILLFRAGSGDVGELRREIEGELRTEFESGDSLAECLWQFLETYQTIFEINLCAEVSVKRLTHALGAPLNGELILGAILEHQSDVHARVEFPADGLVGNSLDLMDEAPFVFARGRDLRDMDLRESLSALPVWKQRYLEPLISRAQEFMRLREIGRWVTVRHVNRIRSAMFALGGPDAFFNSVDELIDGTVGREEALQRKEEWEANKRFTFPAKIGTVKIGTGSDKKSDPFGVSPGVAVGRMLRESEIADLSGSAEKAILYSQILSPNLVKYLPQIAGIVSEQGGILSHLAIMARESGVPVVVNVDPVKVAKLLNTVVTIDGVKGRVEKKG